MERQVIQYKQGNTLSYTDFGNKQGYPVLIQHGLVASIIDDHLFDSLIELGTRLICIARPGYGASSPYEMESMAEWGEIVSLFANQLYLSRFDVLGISSGAPYAYSIGFSNPKVRNIFILSGIPALYDQGICTYWPHQMNPNASIPELEKLAKELFFANLSNDDLQKDDVRDSMMNDCFGIAQDLKIRGMDWGFRLSEVKAKVYMQHSKDDPSIPLVTAEMTCRLLPNSELNVKETDVHFSKELLNEFIQAKMARNYFENCPISL